VASYAGRRLPSDRTDDYCESLTVASAKAC
jgi:hypothetical protein